MNKIDSIVVRPTSDLYLHYKEMFISLENKNYQVIEVKKLDMNRYELKLEDK